MSIRGVCVDMGRVVVKEPSAARVEGTTTFVPVAGQWFRCRLFETGSADTQDAQQGHWKNVDAPQVMAVTTDLDGSVLDFRGDQRLDISSPQLGRAMWRMSGEPQPLRKKRRVIGWLFSVERVVEREYDDLLAENVPNLFEPV